MARDRHPIIVLFLTIDPYSIDTNVHPAKTEVRFHNPSLIRLIIINSINDALKKSNNKVSTRASMTALNYMQTNGKNNISYAAQEHRANFLNSPQKFNTVSNANAQTNILDQIEPSSANIINREEATSESNNTKELDNNFFPLGAAKTQLYNTYIISQSNDSIIITDQHAAHERIGYEKIKSYINKNGLLKQRLLIPEIIELEDKSRLDSIQEHINTLSMLGMTINTFGDKSVIITEMPSLLGDIDIKQIVIDLAEYLYSLGENIILTELIEHVTETYACHYAIRAGRSLNIDEMNSLLRQMESTPFSGQCNHGRQTYIELKRIDIEKLFGRK